MVVTATATGTESEAIVTGTAAAGETTTSDPENDTTMAMAMTTQEAKEGIKSQFGTTVRWWVLVFPNFPTFIYSTSRLSFNKSSTVCWWVPTSSSSAFRVHLLPTSLSRVRKVLEAGHELAVRSPAASFSQQEMFHFQLALSEHFASWIPAITTHSADSLMDDLFHLQRCNATTSAAQSPRLKVMKLLETCYHTPEALWPSRCSRSLSRLLVRHNFLTIPVNSKPAPLLRLVGMYL